MSKTKGNLLRRILLIALCVFLALLIAIGIFFYLEIYDISGLVRLKDQSIQHVYSDGWRLYFVTEDGSGWVGGNYNGSSDRKYRNLVGYHDERFGAPVIRFYDGTDDKICDILRISAGYLLFLTESGRLYDVWERYPTQIASDIVQAFPITAEKIAAVTNTGDIRLFERQHGARAWHLSKEIPLGNVQEVQGIEGIALYALTTDHTLCELMYDETTDDYALSEPIFEDVASFSVTSESVATLKVSYGPCMVVNVLLSNGELYAKESYWSGLFGTEHLFFGSEDWTLLHEGVSSFSLHNAGTVMLLEDGTAAYIGFDSSNGLKSNTDTSYMTLPIEGALSVYASAQFICVETEDAFYLWGENHTLYYLSLDEIYPNNQHNIRSSEPYVLDKAPKNNVFSSCYRKHTDRLEVNTYEMDQKTF